MSLNLPSAAADSVRLADVLASSLAAVTSDDNRLGLPAVDSVIVVVVDGLGAANLRARAGHARTLASALGKGATALTTFPATTASGLTSLTTGEAPGVHGIVGYSVFAREQRTVLNQLTDWGPQMPPETWQRVPTLFERAAPTGLRFDAIGSPKYAESGLSQAMLRGASYLAAGSFEERFAAALTAATTPGVSYLYIAELDMAAHASGWESDRWLARLEELDSALRGALARLPARTGVIVTADHGMVDIPAHRHLDIDVLAPALLDGVIGTAGDPRVLSLWLEKGATAVDRAALATAWQDRLGERAWALTQEQAIDAGLYGPMVDPDVVPRIGDVLLVARKSIALYDGRVASPQSRGMVGQHGALTDEETRVPVLRFGAFA